MNNIRKPEKRKHLKPLIITLSVIAALTALYLTAVFSSIPLISYWRGIWIETAMTTADHQWLATAFIPGSVIDAVMANQTVQVGEVIGGSAYLTTEDTAKAEPDETPGDSDGSQSGETSKPSGTAPSKTPASDDPLSLATLSVGAKDYAGYTVSVVDAEEGLYIADISGTSFKGKVMLIDDPSRVFLGSTPYKGSEGLRIPAMLDYYGAIAGINASGFADPGGTGTGGSVIGISCSQGEYWGDYVDYYGSVLLTEDDKLVVGNIRIWNTYGIRDGIQFGPVLIADGKAQVSGSAGYGIQPRTAIGQREDGVIVMLVIDGRNILHSIGCTVGDMADILTAYGCVNAACCDGGSSSVLAYDGEVQNVNSSANPTLGRRLPNAFLVKSKK